MDLKDNEVELEEIAGDQAIRLSDLVKLLPALQGKYGVHSVVRFTGVAIAPTTVKRLRGESYGGKFTER